MLLIRVNRLDVALRVARMLGTFVRAEEQNKKLLPAKQGLISKTRLVK